MNYRTTSVIGAAALVACGGEAYDPSGPTDPGEPVAATAVVVPSEATLTSIGDVVGLSASARDQNGAAMPGATFTWVSSNEGVAIVGADGSVEATGNGDATITATSGSAQAEATIFVQQVAVSLELVPSHATVMGIGTTADFQLEAVDARGNPLDEATASWVSLNPSVVSVSAAAVLEGTATGERDGEAIVAVTVDGLTEYAVVKVSLQAQGPDRTWIRDPGPSGTLYAVWGAAPDDVWAVGRFGVIRHFDGTAWSDATPGLTTQGLFDVWGTGPEDVWVVGGGPVILHYDGMGWSQLELTVASQSLHGVWGAAPDDLWAACGLCEVWRYDGTSWATGGAAAGMRDMWGLSSSAIWAPGNGGGIRIFDGDAWTNTSPSFVGSAALLGVWGSGMNDVWVVGDGGTIARFDGTDWTDASTSTIGIPRLEGIWGSGPNDVLVVGSTSIFHFDGLEWSATQASTGGRLLDVWGTSGADVWVVGEGMILRGVVGQIAEIDDVILSATSLTIGGPLVPYTATVTNLVGGTLAPVILQAYVDQGAASRAAGGTGVICSSPGAVGSLPPGTCSFDFTFSASNGSAGSGTLVPGDATARFDLLLDDDVLHTFTLPVVLGS